MITWKSKLFRYRIAALCVAALALQAQAQRPSLPRPEIGPKRPSPVEMPRRPAPRKATPAKVSPTTSARINTRARPKFDIQVLKLHGVTLERPRLRGGVLRANSLMLDIVLGNSGSNTFAFGGNLIDASLIEGHLDYRENVKVERQNVGYYPARGEYDIVARPRDSVEVPLVIRGQKKRKVAMFPVPQPSGRPRPGLRAVALKSGNSSLTIRPEVWYTIDTRLDPAENDEIAFQHSAFLNVRFDRSGQVAELQGPYLYN